MITFATNTPINTPVFYHPSIQSLKEYPLRSKVATTCFDFDDDNNPICGPTGLVIPSRPINLYVKSEESPNSAVAGLDIKIGNVYSLKSDTIQYTYTSQLGDFSRPIFQGKNPNCQMVPFLEKIQSSVNFPVDFASLVACLSNETNPNAPKDLKDLISRLGDDPETKSFYNKTTNLLFNDSCIPIPESPPEIEKCQDGTATLSSKNIQDYQKERCKCSETGIRIRTSFIPKTWFFPVGGKDLYDHFTKYGPRPISLSGKDLKKLWIMYQSAENWKDLSQKTEKELDQMFTDRGVSPDDVAGPNGAHMVTLVNVEKLTPPKVILTIRNSWGPGNSQEFDIPWESSDDLDINKSFNHRTSLTRTVLTIETCSIEKGSSCEDEESELETKCKNLGYDSVNLNKKPECPCECGQIVNNRGITIQKIYDKIQGKCRCPEEPRIICGPKYNAQTEQIKDCDCVCKNPDSEFPCSGYKSTYTQLKSNFNIVQLSSIKLF
jgi:hypothetical protein